MFLSLYYLIASLTGKRVSSTRVLLQYINLEKNLTGFGSNLKKTVNEWTFIWMALTGKLHDHSLQNWRFDKMAGVQFQFCTSCLYCSLSKLTSWPCYFGGSPTSLVNSKERLVTLSGEIGSIAVFARWLRRCS